MHTADLERIAAFFDEASEAYDPWFRKDLHYLEALEAVCDALRAFHPPAVAELGCGSGNLTLLLAERFPEAEIVAVDVSRDLLEQARAKTADRPNVTVVEADMLGWARSTSFRGSVAGNLALHHLTDPDKAALCDRLGALVPPGQGFVLGDIFVPPEGAANETARAEAILACFHARCRYYLRQVGLDRAIFELEHIPLILRREQEYLVPEAFWNRCLEQAGFRQASRAIQGADELGNRVLAFRRGGSGA